MNHFYDNKEDVLRDKLLDHEFTPVPGAWDQMSKLLDEQSPVAASPAKGWWWWSATALLVTSSLIGGAYYWGNQTNHQPADATAPAPPAEVEATTALPMASSFAPTTSTSGHQLSLDEAKTNSPAPSTPTANSNRSATAIADVPASIASKEPYPTLVTSKAVPPTQAAPALVATTPAEEPNAIATPTDATEQETISLAEANKNDRPVLKRRVEIINQYSYSTTPLRTLQQDQERLLNAYQGEVGSFGITEELERPARPIRLSAYVGASTQTDAAVSTINVRPVAGMQADYRLAKHHGVQLGLQYHNLAAPMPANTLDVSAPNIEGSLTDVDAIELPLAYQFHPNHRCHIKAGVTTSWLVNARTSNGSALPPQDLSLSPVGVSLLLGAEYEFSEHWSLAVQYNFGVIDMTSNRDYIQIDINNSSTGMPISNRYIALPATWKGSALQFLLRYNF